MIQYTQRFTILLLLTIMLSHPVSAQKSTDQTGLPADLHKNATMQSKWCEENPVVYPDNDHSSAWSTWGGNLQNHRFADEMTTNLNVELIPSLQLKWAYAVSDAGPAGLMRSQPPVAGNWLWMASVDGVIRALHDRNGCLIWQTETDSRFFSGTTLVRLESVQTSPKVQKADFNTQITDSKIYRQCIINNL